MPLISSNISNLFNGVSQQPYQIRDSSHATEQINCRTVLSKGVVKRPPTEFISKLNLPINTTGVAYFYDIIYSQGKPFYLVIGSDFIQVFDIDGNVRHVFGYNTAIQSYVNNNFYRLSTYNVANTTFIINHNTKIFMGKTLPVKQYALLWFRKKPPEPRIEVDFAFLGLTLAPINERNEKHTVRHPFTTIFGEKGTHSIEIEGTQVTYFLQAGNTMAYPNDLKKAFGDNFEIGSLSDQTLGFNNTTHPDLIYLPIFDSNTYYKLYTQIEDTDIDVVLINQVVEQKSELPADFKYDGFIIYVKGTSLAVPEEKESGTYYISTKSGVWKEHVTPKVSGTLNKHTLPHLLQENADGSFTVKQGTWLDRKAGTVTNNPDPYFVGSTISSIYYYQNRLVFITPDGVNISETGVYNNFYRTTVTAVPSSDPILIRPLSNEDYYLTHVLEYAGILVLFSTDAQFFMSSKDGLSLESISFTEYSHYDSSPHIKPLTVGDSIFFVSNTDIMEYKQQDEKTFTADSITALLPSYIPRPLKYMVASETYSMLFLFSPSTPNKIYVCSYKNENKQQKLFNAWSTWEFNESWSIVGLNIDNGILYLCFNDSFFERIDLSLLTTNKDIVYKIHLDRSFALTTTNTTGVVKYDDLPITDHSHTEEWAMVAHGSLPYYGRVLRWDDTTKTLTLPYKHIGTVTLGVQYRYEYVLSPIHYRTTIQQKFTRPVIEGRLQVRTVDFQFSNTGSFTVHIIPHNGKPRTKTYTSKFLSTVYASFDTGKNITTVNSFRTLVSARNTKVDIKITSNNPLPMELISYIWEGYYVNRSKMV